jgi:hypothetical protein
MTDAITQAKYDLEMIDRKIRRKTIELTKETSVPFGMSKKYYEIKELEFQKKTIKDRYNLL